VPLPTGKPLRQISGYSQGRAKKIRKSHHRPEIARHDAARIRLLQEDRDVTRKIGSRRGVARTREFPCGQSAFRCRINAVVWSETMATQLSRSKDRPWKLKRPRGSSEYTVHTDEQKPAKAGELSLCELQHNAKNNRIRAK
jgi:hypothetical protein